MTRSGHGGDARLEAADREVLAATLAACAAAWPMLDGVPPQLAARLLAGWERAGTPLATHLGRTHAIDLCLVTACLARVPAALAEFEARHLARVPAYLSRMHLGDALLADVRQALAEKLLVGAAPKIADYAGRGPLDGWVRVVAVRLAVDMTRARAAQLATGGDDAMEAAPVLADPELEYLRARYHGEFARAFADAVGTLPAAARRLLRAHFVDGRTMDELAARLGVHRMTVLRRMAAARAAVVEATRAQLRTRLRLSDSECASVARLLRSQIDLDLAAALRSRS